MLKRFRLSRFGWQRRRARLRDGLLGVQPLRAFETDPLSDRLVVRSNLVRQVSIAFYTVWKLDIIIIYMYI